MPFPVGGLLFVGVINSWAIVGFLCEGDLGFACFSLLQVNCERTFLPLLLGC